MTQKKDPLATNRMTGHPYRAIVTIFLLTTVFLLLVQPVHSLQKEGSSFAFTKRLFARFKKHPKTRTTTINMDAQDSVNNDWNAMAGEWDDMGGPKMYRDEFVKALWKYTGLEEKEKRVVLDFGCGTGLLTEALRVNAGEDSEFICIDPAVAMTRVVQDKILAGEWKNTKVFNVALANLDKAPEAVQKGLEELKGKVDLIVASSVMSFVPKEDLKATMEILGGLLKPSGVFCHSDWPKSESDSSGFDEASAKEMYQLGGLTAKSANSLSFKMGDQEGAVYFGVAEKQ